MSIHVGDVGTVIVVTVTENGVALDLSAATEKALVFAPPEALAIFEKAASFTTDGKDGKIQYALAAGDLAIDGTWRVQARVTLPTWSGYSDAVSFVVDEALDVY